MNIFNFFIKSILDFLFNDCIVCEEETKFYGEICDKCFNSMEKWPQGKNSSVCFICDRKDICCCDFQSFIPFIYMGLIAKMVLQLKYSQKSYLAEIFAKLIVENTGISDLPRDNLVLVSIPVSRKRLFTREYNQSVLLAEELGKILNIPSYHFVFKKTKNYNQQNKTKEERQKNSKSLEINSIQGILGQNILLVDDIIASGSTISRCTNLLKPLCKSINIVAIAKS